MVYPKDTFHRHLTINQTREIPPILEFLLILGINEHRCLCITYPTLIAFHNHVSGKNLRTLWTGFPRIDTSSPDIPDSIADVSESRTIE
jgi:hypothetical protein